MDQSSNWVSAGSELLASESRTVLEYVSYMHFNIFPGVQELGEGSQGGKSAGTQGREGWFIVLLQRSLLGVFIVRESKEHLG